MILAIDTTSEFGSLALVDRGEVVEEILLHSPDGFGHVIYDQIARLLLRTSRTTEPGGGVCGVPPPVGGPPSGPCTLVRNSRTTEPGGGLHSVRVEDIECFAAASGPGSFTGVRIGLTVAKGLAEITGKRVAAVSNLQALAYFGSADLRATVLDARRGEVFGAVYDRDLNLRSPEVVLKFQDWIKTLPHGDVELISNNPAPFASSVPGMPIVTAPRALAGAIGRIAWKRFEAGETSDPADVDANYVRRSDAELFWRE